MAPDEIQRVLVSRRRIARRVQALAGEIAASYRGRELVLVPLPTGLPLQLPAHHAAVTRRCDVDKPRGRAKSVTVE